MFTNYIKTAWRSIRKNGFHSFINVFGLSIGLLFALLIGSYVWNELGVNRDLRNAERQYFLPSDWKDPNVGVAITTVGPLAKRLKEDYPNLVANYYRWDGITSVVTRGDRHFRENIQLGDSTLLSMFGFELQHGDARTALNQPFSMVIRPELAIKYFGRTDVVGESLSIQSFSGTQRDFAITGVLKDVKENSVTRLNEENNNTIFIPTNTYSYFGRTDFESWDNIYIPSYVELREGIRPEDLQKPIQQLINQNAAEIIRKNLTVRPVALTDYYLENNNGLVKRMLYTLSLVGLFILLMAVVNFVNMSISSSSKRMKEIGMRKVMGGLKKHIVIQFLVESMAIVFLAGLLALAFYTVSKPVFSQIVGKELPDLTDFPLYYLPLVTALIALIGGLAGIYPALVLSSLNSIDSLKGKMKTVKEKVVLRKSLVGFQFCIAAVVMVAAFVVSQQVAHFFSRSLGYNKDFIVSSQVPRDWSVNGFRKMQTVRNEFAAMPEVRDVTLSYEIPNGMNGGQPAVYRQGTDSTGAVAMESMLTDEHYLDTYQIPLRAGRFFRNIESDTTQVVINEKAVAALGWKTPEEAVGQQIKLSGNGIVLTIQGVTRDFHFHTMQRAIPPIIMLNVRLIPTYRFLSFKLKPGNIGRSIEAIQKKWATLLPGSSFEYRFMDDALRKVYASELQIKKAASTATVLALVIVLLGVLGLLSLSVQKRTKEIGIRKVLGASLSSIISLFLKEFLPVLLVGGLVAIPISLYFMKGWLNNYAYRIELSALPFLMTLCLLVLVTSLLIILKVVRASAENPVKNLRTE